MHKRRMRCTHCRTGLTTSGEFLPRDLVSSLVGEIYRADFTRMKIIGRDTFPLKAQTIKQNLDEEQNKQPLKTRNVLYVSEKKGVRRSRRKEARKNQVT